MNDDLRLSEEDLERIKLGDILAREFFYIPIVECEDEEYYEPVRLFYTLKDGTLTDKGYASKVAVRESLWHAVRTDLEKDLGYPAGQRIMIDSVQLHDQALDKYGNMLSRLVVHIAVARYDVSKVQPLGMKLVWEDELPEDTDLSYTR